MHIRTNPDFTLNLSFLNQRTLYFLANIKSHGILHNTNGVFVTYLLHCVNRVELRMSRNLGWMCSGPEVRRTL